VIGPDELIAAAQRAFAAGVWADALRDACAALAAAPARVDALALAANAAIRLGDLDASLPLLERLHAAAPDNGQVRRTLSMTLNNHGSRCLAHGELSRAIESLSRALAVWPHNTEALFNRARLALDDRRPAAAVPFLRRLVELKPDDGDAALLLAEAEVASGDIAALPGLRQRIEDAARAGRVDPARSAVALADAEAPDAALEQVVAIGDVDRFGAGYDAAWRLVENGFGAQSRRAFAHLAGLGGRGERAPTLIGCLGERLALEPVHDSTAALHAERARYDAGLEALDAEFTPARLARCEPNLNQLMWSNFLLAYHGEDDLAPQARYGEFLHRALQAFKPQWLEPPATPARARPRVGLLSSAFRYSTVGSYFGNWVGALGDAGFETWVFQLGPTFDATTERIGARGARVVKLDGDIAMLGQAVRDAQLDLLLFPDLGPDSRILPLAAMRLARRQLVAWGHPVTTGLSTLDGYLSCAAMEPPDAPSHYRERLLLLPGMGTAYERPAAPPGRPRAELGLPGGRLYLVPQSPFKIHPDSDAVFARIAALDPGAVLVFFVAERPGVTRRLQARLARAFAAAGADPARQIAFIPLVVRSRFLDICRACDVMVDTLHWSGGNTTLDSLVSGLPVVSCPGRFMRSRQSMAMLGLLGLDGELVRETPDAQADLAVALATDPDRLAGVRTAIAQRLDVLFEGQAAMTTLAEHVRAVLAD
jgi:CRISPR-associated protein Csy1